MLIAPIALTRSFQLLLAIVVLGIALLGMGAPTAVADPEPPQIASFTAGTSTLTAPESTAVTITTVNPISIGRVSIFDADTGELLAVCYSGSACSYIVHATWENNLNLAPRHFYATVDDGGPAASVTVSFARRTFNVTMSAGTNPVKSGESTPVTATVDFDLAWTGYALSIYDADTGEQKASCSGTSTCAFIYNAGWENNAAPTGRSYYAVVTGYGDQPGRSPNLTVNQERVVFDVGLSASANPVRTGQSSTVTATVAQSINQTGFALKIYDADSGGLIVNCGMTSTCSFVYNADWSNNVAHPDRHYRAVVEGYGSQQSNVATLTLNTERITFDVGITASANPVKSGQASLITATVAQNIAFTGNALKFYDADTGALVLNCGDVSSCSFFFNATWANNADHPDRHFHAVVEGYGDQQSNVASLTVHTERVFFEVGLTASVNPVKAGAQSLVTATVAQSIAFTGNNLKIYDADSGNVVLDCSDLSTCSFFYNAPSDDGSPPSSVRFKAFVSGYGNQQSNTANLSIAVLGTKRSDSELYGGCNEAEPGCDESVGEAADPVSTQSGNFHDTFSDLDVPGRGPAINLTRTYNSGAAGNDSLFGNGWSSPYSMNVSVDAARHSATVTQENGSQVAFAETGGGDFVAAPRVQATLRQNSDNTWTYVRRARDTFTFTPAGRLRTIEDRNGYQTTLTYPSATEIVIDAPGGREVSLDVSAGGHVTAATQSGTSPRTVSYVYDSNRNLVSAYDVLGHVWRYTYNSDNRMLTVRAPKFANDTSTSPDPVVTNSYDSQGRVSSQTDQLGKVTTFDYTSVSGSTLVTDPTGRKRLDSYQDGLRMSQTRGFGSSEAATWTYLYDPNTFQRTSKCNPYSHCSQFTYDSRGNMLTVKDALNRTTSFEYNAQNDVTSATDPGGTKTTLDYDSRGNLLSIARPLKGALGSVVDTQTITYTYDPNNRGDVTQITDPRGKVWKFTYDSYGNPISETAPPTAENSAGNKTTRTFDEATGAITSETAPKGNLSGANAALFTTKFTPDAMGRITTVFDPLWSSSAPTKHREVIHYDFNGNVDYEIDADGDQTNYAYDAADRLKTITRPDGTTLGRSYDDAGRLKAETNGLNAATTYTYDALGYPLTTTDEAGQVTTTSYDAVGNLITRISPGGSCSLLTKPGCAKFTYDSAGQMTGYGWAGGQTPVVSNITYNANGQQTGLTDATGSSTQTYDNLGRMTSRTDGYGSAVSYGYDIAGAKTSITYPGNKTLARTIDAAGRLASVKDWSNNQTTFDYDANSNLTKTTFPSASTNTDTYTYDNADQHMGTVAKKGTTTLASFTYTRTGSGQLASSTTTGISETAQAYVYNTRGQLTKSGSSSTPVNHTYDAADRLTRRVSASTQSFDARGALCWTTTTTVTNPSCAAPPSSATKYVYSPSGNRTRMTQSNGIVTNYTFNENDELTNFNAAASYVYDADGLRASKTLTGKSPTRMVWDKTVENANLLSDGQSTFIYGPAGLPVEQISSTGTVTYLHHDQLGSTRLITSSSGAKVGSYNFDAYGKQAAKTGTVTTPFGFAGQYTDAESGLIYMRARYYDPATGTFISRDPIGSDGSGQNLFGYVGGDPTNAVDPSGLWGMWLSDLAATFLNEVTGGYLERLLGLDPSCGPTGSSRTLGSLLSWLVPGPGKFAKLAKLGKASRAVTVGEHAAGKMASRGWTNDAIREAIKSGEQVKAVNKANNNPATRYIHPSTGQSVVVDDVTGEVIHVGAPGFKYGRGSGDVR